MSMDQHGRPTVTPDATPATLTPARLAYLEALIISPDGLSEASTRELIAEIRRAWGEIESLREALEARTFQVWMLDRSPKGLQRLRELAAAVDRAMIDAARAAVEATS